MAYSILLLAMFQLPVGRRLLEGSEGPLWRAVGLPPDILARGMGQAHRLNPSCTDFPNMRARVGCCVLHGA
eukprot:340162-Alexandrium_andersonii.AAC.1